MTKPLVATQVRKEYVQGSAHIAALAGVDLSVDTGEFVAIMGASGSGKSTLLHACAGLTRIDGGSILIDGQDISKLSDSALTKLRRERIGVVFQAFNLIPTLTAEDNVRLPVLNQLSTDEIRKRSDAIFARLQIDGRRRHRPDALSGGEQQRVAIARALITDPALILLDEPTGSLDSQAGHALCTLLRSLCKDERRTIVVVTHEPAVARHTDHVVVLRDGSIVDRFATSTLTDTQSLSERYLKAQGSTMAVPT